MANCYLYDECNHCNCDKFCERKYKLDYLYSQALVSEKQKKRISIFTDADGTDLDKFTTLNNISNNIVEFVENGYSLYLHSNQCGCGKTTWALRLLQSYFNEIWAETNLRCRALFISVPRFLLALKDFKNENNTYLEQIKNNILSADLVIWDDIAAKMGTDFEISNLLSFIDNRITLGKSNIYTSNLNVDEMTEALGERLASRVCRGSQDIELNGSDKRGIGGLY